MCVCVCVISHQDCFVVSQHFNVAKLTRCFKLKLKLGWLYANRVSYRRDATILNVTERIYIYVCVCVCVCPGYVLGMTLNNSMVNLQ